MKTATSILLLAALLPGPTLAARGDGIDPALENLVQGQAEAWNQRDAGAWGRAYTGDSVFINILGMKFPDRAANTARHAHLFETIFSESHLTIRIDGFRLIAPDVATVDTILELTGYKRLPPGIPATREGVLETRMKYLAVRTEEEGWRFVAAQNTAISPVVAEDR